MHKNPVTRGLVATPSGSPTAYNALSMTFTDGTNRITGRAQTTLAGTTTVAAPVYDNGNNTTGTVTADQTFGYLYDAQGHICAAHAVSGWMGYVYDAEGNRVAKVPLPVAPTSCDPNANGILANFSGATMYMLGPGGETMTEVDSGSWAKTHVMANGRQVATYNTTGIHFQIYDWLGTRRVQANAAGVPEDNCSSQPFGDGQNCTNPALEASDYFFTGKERDAESGLDYFGARYYGSSMGRFMSPDHPLIDQHPENPQSWNLYAYARNNPLINIDPTGLGCVTDMGQGSDANHESVELNNSISSDDCAGQHGTWVPGDVNKDNIGAYRGDDGSINFQATTNTGGNVYYSSFVSGAQTDANGVGPGASIAHASTDWLTSQLVGGSLDQMMSFAANRMEPRGGGGLMALLAGPGFSTDAPDNWAGPGGMGTPQGQGDWAAMVHDYNFFTNNITIGTYFNPFVSRATAKALIQSDNNLVGHAGGAQSVKMGMLFGVVNAFQWLTHPF
jgi:RHS repeat-associated protein